MRGILMLLPVALLCSGCESAPSPVRPQPLPTVSSGPVTLSGTAYDATDEATGTRAPLSGVRVTLHAWNEDFLVEQSVFAETKTDDDGRFSLTFEPRGTVWLGAWKDGYGYFAVRTDHLRGPAVEIELVRR
jgi:5-hydroxyisourate hydrolase-like protein (transthyretin family)